MKFIDRVKTFCVENYKTLIHIGCLLLTFILATISLNLYASAVLNVYAFIGIFIFVIAGYFVVVGFLFGKEWFTNPKHIAVIGLITVIFVYGFYVFNKTAPVSEGWYTTYAQLILDGKRPYADFDFLFPPSYLYFVTIIVAIFGPQYIVLRIVGLYMLIFMTWIVYKILERLVHPFLAMFVSLVSIFFMQNNSAAILLYDYGDFYNIWNFLGLYFLVRYFTIETDKQKYLIKGLFNINILLSGASICVSALARQSSGVIMMVFAACAVVFGLFVTRRKLLFATLSYFIGLALAGIIIMAPTVLSGSLGDFIRLTTSDAISAKGGIFTVLFGWVPRVITVQLLVGSLAFCAVFFVVYLLQERRNKGESVAGLFAGRTLAIILFIFVFGIYVLYHVSTVTNILRSFDNRNLLNPFYMISIIVFFTISILLLIRTIRKKEVSTEMVLLMLLSGYGAFTQFGCCTSASTGETQAILTVALAFIMIPLCFKGVFVSKAVSTIISSLAMLSSLASVSISFANTYYWWGIVQGSIYAQQYHSELSALKGLEMNDTTKYMYEGVEYHVKYDYHEGDEVYCFPHIPIFYNVIGVKPMDGLRAPISWFDVSSNSGLKHDYEMISNVMPRYIVYADLPEGVISGHENGFNGGNRSVQRDFLELFHNWTANGFYTEIYNCNSNAGASGETYYIRVIEVNPEVKEKRTKWIEAGLEDEFDFCWPHHDERFCYFGNDVVSQNLFINSFNGKNGIAEGDYSNPLTLYRIFVSWNPQWIYFDNESLVNPQYSDIVNMLKCYCVQYYEWPTGILFEWNKNIQNTYTTNVSTKDYLYHDNWTTPHYIQTDYVEGASKVEISVYYPASREEVEITLCVDGVLYGGLYNCLPDGKLVTFTCELDSTFPYHAFSLLSKPKTIPVGPDLRDLGAVLSKVNYVVE